MSCLSISWRSLSKHTKRMNLLKACARFHAKYVKKMAVLTAACTGILKRKTHSVWLESGGHAQPWRNILRPKILKYWSAQPGFLARHSKWTLPKFWNQGALNSLKNKSQRNKRRAQQRSDHFSKPSFKLGASSQPVESLPSRASESNDKVERLECWKDGSLEYWVWWNLV